MTNARPLGPDGGPVARALAKVYSGRTHLDSPVFRILVIGRRGDPRWLVDTRAIAAANRVWASWIPYSRKARLAWFLLRLALRLRVLRLLPGVTSVEIPATQFGSWLAANPELENAAPVVYIGKPSVTEKLTVFLATERGKIAAVAKLAMVPGAVESIRNEEHALRQLRGAIHGIPLVLGATSVPGACVESWLDGKSVGRTLTARHISLLRSLPQTGRTTTMRDAFRSLAETLDPRHLALVQRCTPQAGLDVALPCVWEHGDFVPWNLKQLSDGTLFLLDWEYSRAEGLPMLDLLHFFYRQEYLFRDYGGVWRAMGGHPLVQRYCREFDLTVEMQKALAACYLLRSLRHSIPSLASDDTYEDFVAAQLAVLR